MSKPSNVQLTVTVEDLELLVAYLERYQDNDAARLRTAFLFAIATKQTEALRK